MRVLQKINEIEDSIRKRPAMYIGNDGIYDLIYILLNQTVRFNQNDFLFFTISIINNKKTILEIKTKHNIENLLKFYSNNSTYNFDFLSPIILKALSTKYNANGNNNGNSIIINFEIDDSLIFKSVIDFQKLCSVLLKFAVINRNSEVLIKDKRKKYLLQNYFHFKQGIFYYFEHMKSEVLKTGLFEIKYDNMINNIHYQFGVNYRTDWFPNTQQISFINEENTIYGGSHINGIINGLTKAFKKYVKFKKFENYTIKKSKLLNGLIIACSIKTNYNPTFLGSFKQNLDDKIIEKQLESLVSELTYEYLIKNSEVFTDFSYRFDNNHISSMMY
ncbi:MAG: hypothetical protein IPO64_10680 [Bacteroidetes bacterium]|nr:hypothetical protein [Bacteroidota bacterium]